MMQWLLSSILLNQPCGCVEMRKMFHRPQDMNSWQTNFVVLCAPRAYLLRSVVNYGLTCKKPPNAKRFNHIEQ